MIKSKTQGLCNISRIVIKRFLKNTESYQLVTESHFKKMIIKKIYTPKFIIYKLNNNYNYPPAKIVMAKGLVFYY